ncbi:MAG: heme NO-binding domain-containing protein [Rhodobacteraceae bacterium]|nr:heme NO-binding domain-containing protein [Paracoccaceae bacterium]
MHGMINRSIQNFLRGTFGDEVWARVAATAGVDAAGFEAMLSYPDAQTWAVLDAAAGLLGRRRESLLEDLGTFLVSDPGHERLRRLLRFGGSRFPDFVHSLVELQGRGWLAVPDLDLPEIDVREHAPGNFTLRCRSVHRDFGHVLVGVLRAMADDYGALAVIELAAAGNGTAAIAVELLDLDFAEGRRFDLAAGRS